MDNIILVLLLLAVFVCVFILLMQKNNIVDGGNEYLYHGSSQKIDVLEPRPSGVINNEKAVFATPNYIDAVIFAGQWSDYDFTFGGRNPKHLIEMYPNAFSKLDRVGYIHYLSPEGFHKDRRTGMDDEYINKNKVIPVKVVKVNVLDEIKKSPLIQMIKYEDIKLKKERIHNKHIKKVYVPIDFYWEPKIDAVKIDSRNPADIERVKDPNIMLDIVDVFNQVIFEFDDDVEVIVLLPRKYFSTSKNTSAAEKKKFIKCRKQMLNGYKSVKLDQDA